jgi:hypothetical protein
VAVGDAASVGVAAVVGVAGRRSVTVTFGGVPASVTPLGSW